MQSKTCDKKHFRNIMWCCALILGLYIPSHASPAGKYTLNIEPQSRLDALIELATQVQLNLIVDSKLKVFGKSPRVQGEYSASEALALLLKGSNLFYKITDQTIRVLPDRPPVVLPKVTVQGYLSGTSITQNDDGQRDFPAYQPPLSIQSVQQKYFDQVQARDVTDILSYINGVEYFESAGGSNASYYSRGIETPFNIDGMPYRNATRAPDPSVIERIDVVTNPAANYFSPGGLINVVLKKPTFENQAYISTGVGPRDFYRTEGDLDLSLSSKINHGFRMATAYEKHADEKRFAKAEKWIFAPSYAVELPSGTAINMSGYKSKKKEFNNTYTVHESVLGYRLPSSTLLAFPWDSLETNDATLGLNLSQKLNDDWLLNISGNWNKFQADALSAYISVFPAASQTGPSLMGGVAYVYDFGGYSQSEGGELSLERASTLFNQDVVTRMGFGYQRFNTYLPVYTPYDPLYIYYFEQPELFQFNVSQPDYMTPKPIASLTAENDHISYFRGAFLSQNWYFQNGHSMYFNLRYENISLTENSTTFVDPPLYSRDKGNYYEWTPKFGFDIKVSNTFSTFVNYSESFTYQSTSTFADNERLNGQYISPQYNKQLEWSLKKGWRNNSLNSGLTFYKIEQSNLKFGAYSGMTGSQTTYESEPLTSKGASLSLEGKLTSNLGIIANYNRNENYIAINSFAAMADAIQNGTPVPADTQLNGTARKIANMWLYYEGNEKRLKKWDLGLGVKYVGKRYGDNFHSFTLDSYATTDIFANYKATENIKVSLNIRNIFNEYYYKSSYGTYSLVEEGERRGTYLTIKWDNLL